MKILERKRAVVFTAFLVIASIVAATILVPKFLTGSSPLDKSIVKQFVYDIDPTYPPIEGLNVDLFNSQLNPVASVLTNATGYATFSGLVDETYTLKWMWGGVEGSDTVQVTCDQIIYDLGTNYLGSKSG